MPIDHLQTFPLPAHVLPARLRALLTPASSDADARIDVLERIDHNTTGPDREYVHMLMAVVPEAEADAVEVLREAETGVVAMGTPDFAKQGEAASWSPSISDYGYIVAAWSDGEGYGYALAERVWMMLGLVPRGFGNAEQRLAYDDLAAPVFDVAGGELSSRHYFSASRPVHWTMSNAHLRRYLWLNGAVGARVFFYEALVDNDPVWRERMAGRPIADLVDAPKWCRVQLRQHPVHRDRILLQVWATVVAVPPVCLETESPAALIWPDDAAAAVDENRRADHDALVYLDDRVLEHYERDSRFDTVPIVDPDGQCLCSPSYGGQWAFADWVRVGRNLIRVPKYALYKAVPGAEILRVHPYALAEAVWQQRLTGEHIVAKVHRLVAVLLDLADELSTLSQAIGSPVDAAQVFGLSRAAVRANGWGEDPMLRRLAQVAPVNMDEQAFLARCKVLHERWQRLPDGLLRRLVIAAGVPANDVKQFASLRLLQALSNVVEGLNANLERVADALPTTEAPNDWGRRNPHLAALFVTHELRNADAHVAPGKVLAELERFGYDVAGLNSGYGLAFDALLDGVIASLGHVRDDLSDLRQRG